MFQTGDLKGARTFEEERAAIGRVTLAIGARRFDAGATYSMALPTARRTYGVVDFCWGGVR